MCCKVVIKTKIDFSAFFIIPIGPIHVHQGNTSIVPEWKLKYRFIYSILRFYNCHGILVKILCAFLLVKILFEMLYYSSVMDNRNETNLLIDHVMNWIKTWSNHLILIQSSKSILCKFYNNQKCVLNIKIECLKDDVIFVSIFIWHFIGEERCYIKHEQK